VLCEAISCEPTTTAAKEEEEEEEEEEGNYESVVSTLIRVFRGEL
jgi:hypothetical protein